MTDFAEHLAVALEARGHTIADDVLAAAVAAAREAEAAQQVEAVIRRARDEHAAPAPDPIEAERYRELMEASRTCTPSLEDYGVMERFDPNVFWRLECGHHQNLLETALDKVQEYRTAIAHLVTGTPGKES